MYALGNAAIKAAGLVLAPLYLNPTFLAVEEYGYFALLAVTFQFGIYVVGLGISQGLLRFMSDERFSHLHRALPFTALTLTSGAATLLCGAALLAAGPLAELLLDDVGLRFAIVLTVLYVGFKVLAAVPLTLLRVRERAGLYSSAACVETLILIGFALLFVVGKGEGLVGLLKAYAGSAAIICAVAVVAMLRVTSWSFNVDLLRPLVSYGAPLVLAGLAGWFLNAGDRYVLKVLADVEVIALYDWAARLGGIVNMFFVQSFQLAFAVIGLKQLGAGDAGVHRSTFRHYVLWTGWAVLALSLFTFDGMQLLSRWFGISSFYIGADVLVLPIALGFMAYGVYVVVNNILYAAARTGIISRNIALAATANLILNVALIPFLGAMGAALATFIAYTVLAAISAAQAEKEIHVGYQWSLFVAVIVAVVLLYVLALPSTSWPAYVRLPFRAALLAVFIPLMVLGRRVSAGEVMAPVRWLRSRTSTSGRRLG